MTGKRRKNLRSSQKKSSKLVNNQRKYCLRKKRCDLDEENFSSLNEENASMLNEENCSSEVEVPSHEDETRLDPLRVKIRSLISNVSSYVAIMEINIFHNWSCLAPEPQDIFGMLEGAEKLSCFLEEKFYEMKEEEALEMEVENIKYIYCRSKIVVYIIKKILGRLGDIDNDVTYEMIVVSEVNRHMHLIKKFGLKLPMDCTILKTEKNKLLFSDFTVMIESDLGTFSLKETEEVKGILKRPAGDICKASFPVSFLEEKGLKSFETQFYEECQDFEETQISELEMQNFLEIKSKRKLRASDTVTPSPKRLSVGNNPNEPSLSSKTSLDGTSLLIPTILDNPSEKKKRRYNKKLRDPKICESEALNIKENKSNRNLRGISSLSSNESILDKSSLGSDIASCSGTSLISPANSENRLEKKKRAYNKKRNAVNSTSHTENIANNLDKPSLDPEINNIPETSSLIAVKSKKHLKTKKSAYNKKRKATSTSKKLNMGNNPEESLLSSEITSSSEMPVLISQNKENHLEKKEKVHNKTLEDKDNAITMGTTNDDAKQGEIDSEVLVPLSNDDKQEEFHSIVVIPLSDDDKQEEIDYGDGTEPSNEKNRGAFISSNFIVNEIDDDKNEIPVDSINKVSVSLDDEVKEEEIEFGENMNEVDLNTTDLEKLSGHTILSTNLEANSSISSSKTLNDKKSTSKSLLHSEITATPQTIVLIPTNLENSVVKKKRKYTKKQKVDVSNEMGPPVKVVSKRKRKMNPKITKLEDLVLPPQGLETEQEVDDKPVNHIAQIHNAGEAARKIDSNLLNKLGGKSSINVKKYKKSLITIPTKKIINSDLIMDLKIVNIEDEVKKDEQSIQQSNGCLTVEQENKIDKDVQSVKQKNEVDENVQSMIQKNKVNNDVHSVGQGNKFDQDIQSVVQENKFDRTIQSVVQENKFDQDIQSVVQENKFDRDIQSVVQENKFDQDIQSVVQENKFDRDIQSVVQENKFDQDIQLVVQENKFDQEIQSVIQENKFDQDIQLVVQKNKFDQNIQSVVQENKFDQDIQSVVQENKFNRDIQSVVQENKFDQDIQLVVQENKFHQEVPCKNLEEVTMAEKNDCLDDGFSVDTVEKTSKVIDDPSYGVDELKKTLSGVINQSRLSHSRNYSVMHEDNDIKTLSIGNKFNSNPNYNCKATQQNEMLNATNSSQIKNISSDFRPSSKNTNDGKNNVTDSNLGYNSRNYLDDSLDINSNKIDPNTVETSPEELMNTEQFLKNSIDIDYSQNIMPSNVNENDLNSVSLANITKRQYFIGNRVASANCLDLNFSDLSWA